MIELGLLSLSLSLSLSPSSRLDPAAFTPQFQGRHLVQQAEPPAPWTPVLPDIVVFVIDDVGAVDVDLVPTPSLDALGARGTRFPRGYAQPMCAPARHSFFLSRWQGVGGGFACENVTGPTEDTLPQGLTSLPKVMEAAGYNTALFGRWAVGTFPTARSGTEDFALTPRLWGFETWRAGIPDGVSACVPPPGVAGYSNWFRVDDGVTSISTEYQTVALRESFMEWWTQTPSPRFAVVALQAAHQGGTSDAWHIPPPDAMPPGYVPPAGLSLRKRFEAMVQSADHAIGRMMEVVSLDDTFVIALADNGTPKQVPPPGIPSTKLKGSTYEGGVKVPFVIAGLGFPQGRTSDELVSIVDVIPTVADVAGLTYRHGDFDGESLVPALTGAPLQRQWVYVQREKSADYAVIERRWKLKDTDGEQVLFDLAADPQENNPIPTTTGGLEDVVARLRAELAQARS